MSEYSLKTVRDFFDRRARDPRMRAEPMVLSGYGRPEDGAAAWWAAEDVRARLFADIEAKLFAGADPGSLRVLEVGCAGGNLLRLLAGRTRHLVGVDLSLAMLRVAKALPLPPGGLVQANAVALPFRDRSFDRVLCYSVVTNLPGERVVAELLSEAARVLDRGGRVLVGNTPDQRKAADLRALLKSSAPSPSRLRALFDQSWALVKRVLKEPEPNIHNLSFDPVFFEGLARELGLQVRVLPLDVPGYTYAPYRFDVELVKPE